MSDLSKPEAASRGPSSLRLDVTIPRQMMRLRDVCDFTGLNEKVIMRLTRDGRLHSKVLVPGGRRIYNRDDVAELFGIKLWIRK